MPVRVLVTGAGGAAAVSLMQTVTLSEVEFLAGDMDRHAAGLYLVEAGRRHLLPSARKQEFVEELLDLCVLEGVDVLVPTVDVELLPLAVAQAQFEEKGVRVAVPSAAALRMCLDKATLLDACRGDVPTPLSTVLDEAFEALDSEYPLIVKPREGAGGRGFAILKDSSELALQVRDESLLVQEYLPGEEYSVDVLARQDGRVIATVPRVRMKVDSGVAVAARTLHAPELEGYAKAVVERVGLVGIANVQFRRDKHGVPKLLEVNPRVPGTLPLTVESGVPMPDLWLGGLLGYEEPLGNLPFREICMVRTWREHYLPYGEMAALTDGARGP